MRIPWTVFMLQSGRHLSLCKVQRGIIKKNIYIQELWFLRYAHRLMLVNISMAFHEEILNGFEVTERIALCSVLGIAIFFSSGDGNNFESAKICHKKQIFVHTFWQAELTYEVSSSYLVRFKSYVDFRFSDFTFFTNDLTPNRAIIRHTT